MSIRNLKKVYGDNNSLPDPSSEEEYEPYKTNKASTCTYAGLELSSGSEEHVTPANSTEEEEPEPQPEASKKNNKKKKKQKKAKALADDKEIEDEIDKSLKQIHAIMGSPPPATASTSNEKAKPVLVPEILRVQQKHLNVANELKKKFGTDSGEERNKRVSRHAQLRIQKKSLIIPQMENVATLPKVGLSMSVQRREGGYVYFTYDHDPEYQRRQQRLLTNAAAGHMPHMTPGEAQKQMHIESMLECADMMFRMEEYTMANKLIEHSIAYMQFVAHPSFQLTDAATRLDYAYMENRTFHILILKYLYLLTNRACHRTALELAKLLINLDPTDPLAILFIIDTLALRAREHQWLIDAIDHWAKERNAGFLFNITFSYAMAHFHVANKSKGDLTKADDLLQNAMLRFPMILMKIYECANVNPSARLQGHALFTKASEKMTRNLNGLIFLYAKFTWSKWREPAVFEWMKRNAEALADRYDADPALQERAKKLINEGLNLFRSWPDEVIRHLCVIKPMSNLLVDGAVPEVTNLVSSDPAPPNQGVNRYGYTFGPQGAAHDPSQSTIRELLTSLLPNYAVYAPPDLDNQILRLQANNPALAMALALAPEIQDNPIPDEVLDNFDIYFDEEGDQPDNMISSMRTLTDSVRHLINRYQNGRDNPGARAPVAAPNTPVAAATAARTATRAAAPTAAPIAAPTAAVTTAAPTAAVTAAVTAAPVAAATAARAATRAAARSAARTAAPIAAPTAAVTAAAPTAAVTAAATAAPTPAVTAAPAAAPTAATAVQNLVMDEKLQRDDPTDDECWD